MNTKRYRVYDFMGRYVQSYNSQVKGANSFARDCAKRIGGYVEEIALDKDGDEVGKKISFDARAK